MLCKKNCKNSKFYLSFFQWQSAERTTIGLYCVWFSSSFVKTLILYCYSKLFRYLKSAHCGPILWAFSTKMAEVKKNKKVTKITAFCPGFFIQCYSRGLFVSFGKNAVQIGQYGSFLLFFKVILVRIADLCNVGIFDQNGEG